MRRRSLLTGSAALLAAPAIAANVKPLRYVPQSPLASLDPVWTSAMTTRNVGFMVYDVLFGRDERMKPKPQMLAGYVIEDDGKRWDMTLRDGLWFHDGTKVLARDCTASLRRWMKRDPAGATLEARLDAVEAPDDRTIRLRLKKPFPHLPQLLSKFQTAAVMVPERLARTDPHKQLPETIGSGPFRFLADEYVIGSHAAMAKFDRYVPRDEPADFTSGGHRVLVDRVEWKMIPDPGTAANALLTGEVDWLEMPMPDLLPMLARNPNIVIDRLDNWGFISQLRPNHMVAPTNNAAFRRALLATIDQKEVMEAMMGSDPGSYMTPMGYLATGKPEVDRAGIEAATTRRSPAELKAMFAAAGYKGEKIVLLHTSDQPFYHAATLVVADSLSRAGLNVDDQAMDWGTVLQRRAKKDPIEQGGWSLFVSVTPVPEYINPLLGSLLRGNGKDAWIGWPDIPKIEAAYNTWLDTADPAAQTRLEREIHLTAYDEVPFIPMGRYMPRVAWTKAMSAPLKGPAPVFWDIRKA